MSVHPGRQVLVTEKKVLLRKAPSAVVPSPPVPLKLNGCTFWEDKGLETRLENERNNEFLKNLGKNPLKNSLDYDRIVGDLFLRVRKPGDPNSSYWRIRRETAEKIVLGTAGTCS